jgi:hypothetical protein
MHFDFEDGTTQGWRVHWGAATLANSARVAYTGTHSLAVTFPSSTIDSGVEVTNTSGIVPGTIVTYHVYIPSSKRLGLTPYSIDSTGAGTFLPIQYTHSGWNTVTWTMQSKAGLRVIGLDISNNFGFSGTVNLDDVSWTSNIRYDFEDGTTQGWYIHWGAVTPSNSTKVAYTGTHSLAVTFPSSTIDSGIEVTNASGIVPGAIITYHVYIPTSTRLGLTPYFIDSTGVGTFLPIQYTHSGWNTVTWTMPSETGLRVIGLDISNNFGFSGTINLDSVGWTN